MSGKNVVLSSVHVTTLDCTAPADTREVEVKYVYGGGGGVVC